MKSHVQIALEQIAAAATTARHARLDHPKDSPDWIRLGARATALDDAVATMRAAIRNDVAYEF